MDVSIHKRQPSETTLLLFLDPPQVEGVVAYDVFATGFDGRFVSLDMICIGLVVLVADLKRAVAIGFLLQQIPVMTSVF